MCLYWPCWCLHSEQDKTLVQANALTADRFQYQAFGPKNFTPSTSELVRWLKVIGPPPLLSDDVATGQDSISHELAYEYVHRWAQMESIGPEGRAQLVGVATVTSEFCEEQSSTWGMVAAQKKVDEKEKRKQKVAEAGDDEEDGVSDEVVEALLDEEVAADSSVESSKKEDTDGGGEFLYLHELTDAAARSFSRFVVVYYCRHRRIHIISVIIICFPLHNADVLWKGLLRRSTLPSPYRDSG